MIGVVEYIGESPCATLPTVVDGTFLSTLLTCHIKGDVEICFTGNRNEISPMQSPFCARALGVLLSAEYLEREGAFPSLNHCDTFAQKYPRHLQIFLVFFVGKKCRYDL